MGLIKGLLGKLWSTAKSRFRLWIEYVLIAVAIVALAWVVATHSRNQRLQDNVQQLQQEQGSLSVDRKSTRLNSSHVAISYAVFCLKKKKNNKSNKKFT